MRITHLCLACIYADGFSYQENILPQIHKRQGHDVQVITSLQSINTKGEFYYLPEATEYFNEYGIKVTRLAYHKPNKLNQKLKRFNGLYKSLVKTNPDILFIHGCQFLDADVVERYLKKHTAVKVFVDNHADYHNSAKTFVSKYLLHRVLWKHSAKILNPYIEKWYGVLPARVDFLINEYQVPASKVELLVMGIDDKSVIKASLPETKQFIRRKYGISDEDFLIITGGKITLEKRRTIDLMSAVNKLDREHVKLIVFGSIAPELNEQVMNECSDLVQYIGWINSSNTADYFAAADLVVFPGLHSVFWEQVVGLGIPMICSKIEGTYHVDLGGNVKFITYDDEDVIFKTIKMVIDSGEYQKMKKVAAEKGFSTFSYEKIAARSIGEDI